MRHIKNLIVLCLVCLMVISASAKVDGVMNEPDNVYLFSYCTAQDGGRSGLKFAWSADGEQWFSIGNGWAFVKSDFGAWGSHKILLRLPSQQIR